LQAGFLQSEFKVESSTAGIESLTAGGLPKIKFKIDAIRESS